MDRLLKAGSVSLGLWLGWWTGSHVNIWMAVILGSLGTAAGWFVYRRYLSNII